MGNEIILPFSIFVQTSDYVIPVDTVLQNFLMMGRNRGSRYAAYLINSL